MRKTTSLSNNFYLCVYNDQKLAYTCHYIVNPFLVLMNFPSHWIYMATVEFSTGDILEHHFLVTYREIPYLISKHFCVCVCVQPIPFLQ